MSDRYRPRTAMFKLDADRPTMTPEVARELGYDLPNAGRVDKENKDQNVDVCAEGAHFTLTEALAALGRSTPVGSYDYTLGRYTS